MSDITTMQLDQRESGGQRRRAPRVCIAVLCIVGYQSLYFVPSRAVPPLVERTSKTFWPPQRVASGLS